MAIGYRAILSVKYSQEVLSSIVGTLREWVTEKKRFAALPAKGETLSNSYGSTLTAIEMRVRDRGISGLRWILKEEWTPPHWYKSSETSRTGVTHVSLVFSDDGELWLWTDVEPPTLEYADYSGRQRVEAQQSGTPAFISDILQRVEMHDGVERPVANIQRIVTDHHVQHLLEVLGDQSRHGAVYVTSPPIDANIDDWHEKTERILGRIEGMGFGYLLSPETRNIFNRRVAPGHTIPAGSIRTFLPGADLEEPKDALRHRLLHASTIRENQDWRLQRIIRNAQIERLRDVALPEVLREADYAFLRQRGLDSFDVLRADPSVSTEIDSAERVEALLKKLSEAEELLTMALDDNEDLRRSEVAVRSEADALRTENEEIFLDVAVLRETHERNQREIDYLRRELSRLGADGPAAAFGFVDDIAPEQYPATFSDLIDRIPSLRGVQYFGNRADAEDLDEFSNLGDAALMKTWDALVTFNAYACARADGRYEDSLKQYIQNTQHGFPMRVSRPQWHEGQTVRTNSKMLEQRTVSGLPESIDPTGSKVLVAHIALATGRANSPRLYFDDTFTAAGFVTVGYIGAHLDNTLTN